MNRPCTLALAGATGAVGTALLEYLQQRRFPLGSLHLLAGPRSAGTRIPLAGGERQVQLLSEFDFAGVDLALFAVDAGLAREHVPRAVAAGCVAVDCSAAFRQDPEVPLVVAQVNPQALDGWRARRIVACPGSGTAQLCRVLGPLQARAGIAEVQVASLHPVSESGRAAIEELAGQSASLLNGRPIEPRVYPQQIAFNCLPLVGAPRPDGDTQEEYELQIETRKILQDARIVLSATAVRVPVFYGQCQAVHLVTRQALAAAEARAALRDAPGVMPADAVDPAAMPTPVSHAAGSDAVFVGRLRADPARPNGLKFWVVADNVRSGAALNCVQIAEILVKSHL